MTKFAVSQILTKQKTDVFEHKLLIFKQMENGTESLPNTRGLPWKNISTTLL
jgi:hypothetical protein